MSLPLRSDDVAAVGETLEAFARELLHLIRGVQIYPSGHPFLESAGARLQRLATSLSEDALCIGVTPHELVQGRAFVGGAGTKAGALAALLHGRRIGRLRWSRQATGPDALAFARVFADRSAVGPALQQALEGQGLGTIGVEPLDLERIHEALRSGAVAEQDADLRRQEAWRWLHDGAGAAEVARALESEGLWQGQTSTELGGALLSLGRRLEEALGVLPEASRTAVLGRIEAAGRSVPLAEIAAALAEDGGCDDLHGAGLSALVGEFDADRFLELLAALVARGAAGTRRLASVFRRFSPCGPDRATDLLTARLASPGGRTVATEVWDTVREFLLRLQEDPFMEADYRGDLERVSGTAGGAPARSNPLAFAEGAEHNLEFVYLGLACQGGGAREGAVSWLETRLSTLPPLGAVALAGALERALPGSLRARPGLPRALLGRALATVRDLSPPAQGRLLAFFAEHEEAFVEAALRGLAEEGRVAGRRFLVEVLCAFSPSTLPALVARGRAGPWYVTRNIALVLGRRGDPRAVATLRLFADEHPHPKVRQEALRALARLGRPAEGGKAP